MLHNGQKSINPCFRVHCCCMHTSRVNLDGEDLGVIELRRPLIDLDQLQLGVLRFGRIA
jgi:hypothetical protein